MSYRHTPATMSDLVVDLSAHANKLMAYEDISDDLTEDQEQKLVDYVKACLEMSHAAISKRYDHWLEADRAHDVYVPPDVTEFREKAVIADTRAISDTVLTYFMAALFGRNPMFQLEGLNRNSRTSALIFERVLHQQMRRTAGEAKLAQLLLDNIRYGCAPTKILWDAEANQNRIINVNPRRFFPDPRVHWSDWHKMQFVGFTDYASYSALARSRAFPKLTKYPGLRSNVSFRSGWTCHRTHRDEGRGLSIDPIIVDRTSTHSFTLGNARVVDELWLVLSGYEIGLPQLGHVYLLINVIDEAVVIRLQLNPYGRQFPTVIGGLYQDVHRTFGQSLYDILLPMHDIATWLLRSRVDNVQAALNNLIFADPTQVSIPDLIDRNPWGIVRTLNGSKPGDGVFVAQVPDVTRGHLNDIAFLGDLKQRVSAASDAQQGVPTPDIRTATEIARLTQLGSQRLGVLARITSANTIRPMVTMMVSNIQDAMRIDGSVRVDPDQMPAALASLTQDGYIDYDQSSLQGSIDYLVIDGTLPVEPTRSPETWMNMLKIMAETGLNAEFDMQKIAEEGIRSLGISDLDRFRLSKERVQREGLPPNAQLTIMEKMRGASVMPNEQVQREVERGNLVPMRGGQ